MTLPRLVCVAMSPSIDVTYVVDRLAVGRIHRPREIRRLPGGKGINVARVAHQLGAHVAATGIVAGHSGAWLVDQLRTAGVPFHAVHGRGETRACISIADLSSGEMSQVYEPGTPVDAESWRDLVGHVWRLARGASWVALCGGLPAGVPQEGMTYLLQAARAGGARIAVDTYGDALAVAVEHGCDLIKVNHLEARALLEGLLPATCRSDFRDPNLTAVHGDWPAAQADPLDLAHRLMGQAERSQVVIVTAGEAGAAASVSHGPTLWCSTGVHGDFPVGSGDSFLGGLLARLLTDPDDIETALRVAVAAGAANAVVPGAARVDVRTIDRLAARALVDAVPVAV